jgi:hypothetical protein
MISLKKIYLIFFFVTTFLLSYISYLNYTGSKIIFLIYCIISIFFFLYLTDKKSFFIENFIALYFFVAYWLGFCIKISFFDSNFDEYSDGYGAFDFSKNSFDEVVIIVSFSFLAFILSSYIRRKFIRYPKIKFNLKKKISLSEIKISIFIFTLLILLAYLNYSFEIFQKGKISNIEINLIIINFIKWFFSFGYLTVFCFLIFWFIQHDYKFPLYLTLSYIVAEFLVSLSISSRIMIFNGSSIFWGIKNILKKNHFNKILYLFIFFVILFITNVYFINKIRVSSVVETSWYTSSKSETIDTERNKQTNLNLDNNNTDSQNSRFIRLFVSRIHGFEALMAVQSIDYKDIYFFLDGLKSKTLPNEVSFFDSLKNDDRQKSFTNNSITIPGLLAFLYYSGSIYFIFFVCFILILLISVFEKLIYSFSGGNLIFASFISHMIAFRLWHFGHNPLNTHLYLISIFLSVILIVYLRKIFK